MKFISETEQQKSRRETKLLDALIESRKGIWDEKYSHVQINESEHGITSYWRFDSPSFVPQIFSREEFLERAKQLAAMGAELRLTEEQAKGLAERMPQTGTLQNLDDQPLCMANRIEELEAQVRVMAELLREVTKVIPAIGVAIDDLPVVDAFLEHIEAALDGNLPEPAMPEGWKLVEKANCFTLVSNGQVIASMAGPTAEGTAAILASVLDGKGSYHAEPEGWQLVPVEPTEKMLSEAIDAGWFDEDDAVIFWASMLAAAPKPDATK